jgi:hypothetical protein
MAIMNAAANTNRTRTGVDFTIVVRFRPRG